MIGSSPRMRGTLRSAEGLHDLVRFIPAYAGNATQSKRIRSLTTVHPRVCGERIPPIEGPYHMAGSSPRMRGTPLENSARHYQVRFIPAYAGNASPDRSDGLALTVHPRVCGERRVFHPSLACSDGSSPRMRGTRTYDEVFMRMTRFIPAYAGNAALRANYAAGRSVHPRVCGERELARLMGFPDTGSSPRMRGTLASNQFRPAGQRFIPAYAGNASVIDRFRMLPAVHPRVCGERKSLNSTLSR